MNWYEKSNIKVSATVVNPGTQYEAELVPTADGRALFSEIYWMSADGYDNSVSISVLAANQGGLLYSANYISVSMRSSPRDELEKQIFSGMQQSLGGMKATPYSEGKNPFMQHMESVTGKPLDTDEEGNVYQIPQEGKTGIIDEGG